MKGDNIFKKGNKILILSPHTDDGELGCGGTIARLVESECEVYYVAFSICEDSVSAPYPKNILEIEVIKATAVLGVKPDHLIIHKYPVRKLNEYRQEILEQLVVLRNELKPTAIFMPNSQDLHQDHKTIYEEGLRAFKHFTCFGFDLPWNTISFSSGSFVLLEEHHIQRKWESIACYESQNWRTYCDRDFVFGLARVRGAQIAEKYAEAFESIRNIY